MIRSYCVYVVAEITVGMSLWWLIAARELVPNYVVPHPWDTLKALSANRIQLTVSAADTLLTALLGFGLAMTFGLAIGLLIHRYKSLRSIIIPLLVGLKSIPVIALVPVVTLVIGAGAAAKLFFAFMVCFLPMVLSSLYGLERLSVGLRDFLDVVPTTPIKYLRLVLVPSAWNEILLGMKLTLPLAFVGAVVAEMVGGYDTGLGYLILSASQRLETPQLYAAVIVLGVVATSTFYLLTALACTLFPGTTQEITI